MVEYLDKFYQKWLRKRVQCFAIIHMYSYSYLDINKFGLVHTCVLKKHTRLCLSIKYRFSACLSLMDVQAVITAKDRSVSPKSSSATVDIYIVRNQFTPRFLGTPYILTEPDLAANAGLGVSLLQVSATDDDLNVDLSRDVSTRTTSLMWWWNCLFLGALALSVFHYVFISKHLLDSYASLASVSAQFFSAVQVEWCTLCTCTQIEEHSVQM